MTPTCKLPRLISSYLSGVANELCFMQIAAAYQFFIFLCKLKSANYYLTARYKSPEQDSNL